MAAVISRLAPAGVVEYLLVQEETAEGLRLNNPAGHLEQGESPQEAVVREVLEETACHFHPEAFLGVFLARFQRAMRQDSLRAPAGEPDAAATTQDVTYVRLAYAGRVGEPLPGRALDAGIVATCWLSAEALWERRAEWRSPLVGRSIQAHLAGRGLPLETVWADPTVWQPEQR